LTLAWITTVFWEGYSPTSKITMDEQNSQKMDVRSIFQEIRIRIKKRSVRS